MSRCHCCAWPDLLPCCWHWRAQGLRTVDYAECCRGESQVPDSWLRPHIPCCWPHMRCPTLADFACCCSHACSVFTLPPLHLRPAGLVCWWSYHGRHRQAGLCRALPAIRPLLAAAAETAHTSAWAKRCGRRARRVLPAYRALSAAQASSCHPGVAPG